MADVTAKVLLIDDDSELVQSLARTLRVKGLDARIDGVSSASTALSFVSKERPQVVVVDLCLDEHIGVQGGFELIERIREVDATCRVIVLTGHAGIEHGVRALRCGAASFIQKPPDVSHLQALIRDGITQSAIMRRVVEIERGKGREAALGAIVGEGPRYQQLVSAISYAARTNQPVLITGETGTGKGLSAQVIHRLSQRSSRPLVRYQPSFAQADLVGSELFGHRRGAFTGAVEERRGLISEADGGTLFLDEVDELPPQTQVSLLGVLQDRRFRPIGATKEESADFRLIAASNQDIDECVANGKVRADLFHRIAHLRVHIPPLRERLEDIPLIAERILERLRERERVDVIRVSDAALMRLSQYAWPGNIRELEGVLEGAAYRAQFSGRCIVGAEDVELRRDAATTVFQSNSFHQKVEEFKVKLIHDALRAFDGNQVRAAAALGLDRSSLRRFMRRAEPS